MDCFSVSKKKKVITFLNNLKLKPLYFYGLIKKFEVSFKES